MSLLYKYKNETESKRKLLNIIYNKRGLSRSEIMEKTGLSLVTVLNGVSELIADGAVMQCGTLESTGGRKPELIGINPEFAYIIGIDVGSYSMKIGVIRIDGSLVEKDTVLLDSSVMPARGADLELIYRKIDAIIVKYGKSKFLGIGFGISGMVNNEKGEVIFCPNIYGWDNVHVVNYLEERYGMPVFLDTSSRCSALAEQRFGCGSGVSNFVFVSIGYSISAGIIADSKIFKGNNGFAGELGHVQVNEDGARCTCGNYGCLELYATLPIIVKKVKNMLKDNNVYSPIRNLVSRVEDINKDTITTSLELGDRIVYEAISNAGKLIGIALSNMLGIINPSLVILGGGVIENFPSIVDEISRTIKMRCLTMIQQDLEIKKSSLGWDAPLIGSATLLINEFLR